MRRADIIRLATIFEPIAAKARQNCEFAELTKIARYLDKLTWLPAVKPIQGHVRTQIDRTEELIACLLGLEESISTLGLFYRDIPRLKALTAAIDIVTPNLNAARKLRGRLSG